MSTWIAGCDKPHRCPGCWRCAWTDDRLRSEFWRVAKWLPRRCRYCGDLTLTTALRRIWGRRIIRGGDSA